MSLRRLRATLLVTAMSATAMAGLATAATPSKSGTATFYLRQEGCGTSATPGRLDPKKGVDDATGCGGNAGIPFDEAFHQVDGPAPEPYTSAKNGVGFKLKGSGKVVGQLAAMSWYQQPGVGGVGTVTFDVSLVAVTSKGKTIDFGSKTVSAQASPTEMVLLVPFELAVPKGVDGAVISKVILSVAQHGANLGMSAKRLDGDSWLSLPKK
jgi:hypothetical protein